VSRCWPPELVTTDLDGELNCPVCGRVSYEQRRELRGGQKRLVNGQQKRVRLNESRFASRRLADADLAQLAIDARAVTFCAAPALLSDRPTRADGCS